LKEESKMTKLKTIDPKSCDIIRAALDEKLAELSEMGLSCEVGRMTYAPGSHVSCKVTFSLVSDDGVVSTPERKAYQDYAAHDWTDMKPEWLDKTFRSHGRTHTIVGYRTRARKSPVLTSADNGKQYIFSEEDIVRAMKLESMSA
jgi:hypothetical protein